MRQLIFGIAASAALALAPPPASAHGGGVSIGGYGGHGGIHWQIQLPIHRDRHHRPRHHKPQRRHAPRYWQNHDGGWWRHRQHRSVSPPRHHGGQHSQGGGHRYKRH